MNAEYVPSGNESILKKIHCFSSKSTVPIILACALQFAQLSLALIDILSSDVSLSGFLGLNISRIVFSVLSLFLFLIWKRMKLVLSFSCLLALVLAETISRFLISSLSLPFFIVGFMLPHPLFLLSILGIISCVSKQKQVKYASITFVIISMMFSPFVQQYIVVPYGIDALIYTNYYSASGALMRLFPTSVIYQYGVAVGALINFSVSLCYVPLLASICFSDEIPLSNIIIDVLAAVFTHGIYALYFFPYRLIKTVHFYIKDNSTVAKKYLCFILVPLYMIYWLITRSKRLQFAAEKHSFNVTPKPVAYVILSIFFPFGAMLLLQSDINKFFLGNKRFPSNTEKTTAYEALERLFALYEKGAISQSEYENEKKQLLPKC